MGGLSGAGREFLDGFLASDPGELLPAAQRVADGDDVDRSSTRITGECGAPDLLVGGDGEVLGVEDLGEIEEEFRCGEDAGDDAGFRLGVDREVVGRHQSTAQMSTPAIQPVAR